MDFRIPLINISTDLYLTASGKWCRVPILFDPEGAELRPFRA
jgi:hypothetical protein